MRPVTICYKITPPACILTPPPVKQTYNKAPQTESTAPSTVHDRQGLHQPVGDPLLQELESGLDILAFTEIVLTVAKRNRTDFTYSRVLD